MTNPLATHKSLARLAVVLAISALAVAFALLLGLAGIGGPVGAGGAGAKLDDFIKALAGGLNLWTGPLNLQDGTVYLKDGEVATDQQIWYLPQLLQGVEGQSVSK